MSGLGGRTSYFEHQTSNQKYMKGLFKKFAFLFPAIWATLLITVIVLTFLGFNNCDNSPIGTIFPAPCLPPLGPFAYYLLYLSIALEDMLDV